MGEAITVEELLDLGERVMADSSHIFDDHDNRDEAETLLALTLGEDVDDLDLEGKPTRRQRERYLSLVARRASGEPLPFLTGRIEFYGLDLKVKPGPFVPRPSSELTVGRAIPKLRRKANPRAVDVCTGAGPIAIAIAAEVPQADVWGVDIDAEGIAQARMNARRLEIDNATFKKGDMYGPLPASLKGTVDLVTGHVPYVPPEELDDLPSEVRSHEPVFTLSDNSSDGLGLMRRAIDEGREWLKPGGWLLLEVAEDLAPKIRTLCKKAGYEDLAIQSDEDGLSVVIEGRKGSSRPRRERRG